MDVANSTPRVTVFIPAFNVEYFIAEAVDSVLQQTFRDFELLVIDDGSTDATLDILNRYCDDARVRVVSNAQNLGRPATRNRGLDLARGELIAFLDGDDLCVPERLERQVAYLDAHPEIHGLGTWMTIIDELGHGSGNIFYEEALTSAQIACEMLIGCAIAQSSMMVRMRAISLFRYDLTFPVAQDYELWVRMIRTCRFANITQPLTHYRVHATQATTARAEEQRALIRTIYGYQVAALGMAYTERDLAQHECLFRLEGRRPVREKTGAPLDIHYLRWARRWLESIIKGNKKQQIYPEPALSHMLAPRWLFACRKAARNSPLHLIAIEFFYPSLLAAVLSYARQQLKMHFTARRLDENAD